MSADTQAWKTLQRAIIGYRLSFALGVAARLGIADLLRDRPRAVGELAGEMVLRPGNTPFYGRWTDVNMLVLLGGRERTEAEYRAPLDSAGLRLARITPTASDFSIVEAVA